MQCCRRAAAALLAALGLSGCGLLEPARTPESAPPPAPAAPLVALVVKAPDELKRLLQTHLDLAKLTRLAGGQSVSEAEIARLVGVAPAQVHDLLETEGYFQPVVTVSRVPATDPPQVQVEVLPGPRVHVRRITLEVEGELERRASTGDEAARIALQGLREGFKLKLGDPFRNPVWGQAKAATLAQLRGEGYAAAVWNGSSAQVDVAEDAARLFLAADSGPLFRAGLLEIEGLNHQSEADVRNLAGFRPGDALTDRVLLDFQERLQAAGLFDNASVTLDPAPDRAAAARVRVRVHEQALQQTTTGVGYSEQAGPRASLEHWHRRLLGLPVTSRTKLEWGRDRQALEGDVTTHARADFWRNLLGYGLTRQKTSTDTVTTSRLRLGRAQDTPRLQRLVFGELTRSRRTTATLREQASAVSANYNWGWRELDSNLLPTRGFTVTLEGGAGRAHDQANLAGGFARLYGRAALYRPLGDQWFGSARLELGSVMQTNEVQVPDALRFRAGGDESVRGYGYQTLAPKDAWGNLVGGSALFTGSVELGHPISRDLPSVWWALFVDAGRAANSFAHLVPAYGAGFGVHWRSPVGPLKLDLAWGNETRQTHLHLSVGIVF